LVSCVSESANVPAVSTPSSVSPGTTDVLLVGAGIMSATLGTLLKMLQPDWTMSVVERLPQPAQESSDPWNNAGTGHSALCELNYTPQKADGTVDVTKAITVNEQFQLSRQFWSFGVENGHLSTPSSFINPVPHVSFVTGEADAQYLRKRYDALAGNPLFEGMEYVDDSAEFAQRLPLMAQGRDAAQKVALNWSDNGTDVDFGSLTRQLVANLSQRGADVRYGTEVVKLSRDGEGWAVTLRDLATKAKTRVRARFVFVGAGGGALHLLQKAGISEIKGFGGFPVSGQFLRCLDSSIAEQHDAKVYGKAAVGAPPMSVPHLDTRVIDGQRSLLFGPYAGWSPKFLKAGSVTDLPRSIRPNNLFSMLGVGLNSFSLTKYLISELLKGQEKKVEALRDFAPLAESGQWELITAGQRVQVIKRNGASGTLEFGTSVVNAADGSIAGLLGASPGASTAVAAMLDVLEKCFPDRIDGWRPQLKEVVPSYGVHLRENPSLLADLRAYTDKTLQLA
jgi:malate dehydrogenase (quinone)